jgi:hypothetical protein
LAVKSPAELASSLRLVNESQLKILLRSEDIRGPWDSYKSDTALLPLQSTPSKRATIRHAVNSVDNVIDLRSQSIDKSTWTIDHHCTRLLLLWSEALTGPGGKLQGFENWFPQKKDHYSILFNIYAKMNDDHVVPNLLSSEPGVKILWQWLAAPDEPQNEASRGVTSLTYNEAMRVVEDIFNLSSGGYEFMTFIHPVLGVEVFEEGDWVRLVHERSRKIRREKSRQITIEVHTIGPGFWVSSSANPELAEAEKSGTKFILYNKDNV